MSENFEDELKAVIMRMTTSFKEDLYNSGEEDLEQYWHFEWDDSITKERNLYEFYKNLKLYSSLCRDWEEHHHGHFCVVERVRDKYIMPKIKKFVEQING